MSDTRAEAVERLDAFCTEAERRRDFKGGMDHDLVSRALEAEEVSTRFCAGLTEIVRQFGDTPGGHMAAIIARAALQEGGSHE